MNFRALSLFVWFVLLVGACGGSAARTGPVDLLVAPAHTKEVKPVAPAPEASEADARIPIMSDDAVRGDRRAYVTLVVFTDFQCPFCGRLEPTLARLVEEMGPNNLRIVHKDNPLPFHAHA